MEELEQLLREDRSGGGRRVRWRSLLVTLLLGGAAVAIAFLLGGWWVGGGMCALVLLVAIFTSGIHPGYRPLLVTLWLWLVLTWLVGSWVDVPLARRFWMWSDARRAIVSTAIGALVGGGVVMLAVLALGAIATRWVLDLVPEPGFSFGQALRQVLARFYGLGQAYIVVEDGKILVEKPPGVMSKLKCPGLLIVRVANAVALERFGRPTRIVGPGKYHLRRFEFIREIVDLRNQFLIHTEENVLTADGVPLRVKVAVGYRIEPKEVTDQRTGGVHAGPPEDWEVLSPESCSVYRGAVRRAVYNTGTKGWKAAFPGGPVARMRDLVRQYRFDQLFLDPEGKMLNSAIRQIEDQVRKMDFSASGAILTAFDIREIDFPPAMQKSLHELREAQLEGRMLTYLAEGRAQAISKLEKARSRAREETLEVLSRFAEQIARYPNVAPRFIRIVERMTRNVGEDDAVLMRYIEIMEAVAESGDKKAMLWETHDMLQQSIRRRLPGGEGESKEEGEGEKGS